MALLSLRLPFSSSWESCPSDLGDGRLMVVATTLVASYSSSVPHGVVRNKESSSSELLKTSPWRSRPKKGASCFGSGLLPWEGGVSYVAGCDGGGWSMQSVLQDAKRRLARCKRKTCDVLACTFCLAHCSTPSWLYHY